MGLTHRHAIATGIAAIGGGLAGCTGEGAAVAGVGTDRSRSRASRDTTNRRVSAAARTPTISDDAASTSLSNRRRTPPHSPRRNRPRRARIGSKLSHRRVQCVHRGGARPPRGDRDGVRDQHVVRPDLGPGKAPAPAGKRASWGGAADDLRGQDVGRHVGVHRSRVSASEPSATASGPQV